MTAVSLVDFGRIGFAELSYLPLVGALSLSVLLILFGSGPGSSAAKVNLGPVQPIEAIRLLLALFLAGYFARRWELLRDAAQQRRSATSGCRRGSTCRAPNTCCRSSPASALRSLFFFLQKDLGPALFLCCVFLAVYAVARGRVGMAVAGFAAARARLLCRLSAATSRATLAERVRMWQSPWDNAVAGGDQVAQAIWAMATGGRFGHRPRPRRLALSAGRPHRSVLAAIGEELGAVGLIVVAVPLRDPRVARLPHRTPRARTTTASFSRPR